MSEERFEDGPMEMLFLHLGQSTFISELGGCDQSAGHRLVYMGTGTHVDRLNKLFILSVLKIFPIHSIACLNFVVFN